MRMIWGPEERVAMVVVQKEELQWRQCRMKSYGNDGGGGEAIATVVVLEEELQQR